MAVADYTAVVQQLYVSYFGRPADFYGLTSFKKQLADLNAPSDFVALNAAAQSGKNPGLTALVNNFNASTESTNLYGAGTSVAAISKFVNAVYNNVLNRDADLDGLAYWVNAITQGTLSKANAAAAITEGALSNTTAQGLIDAKCVAQKTAVATDFTGSLNTAAYINSYSGDSAAATARNLLKMVNNLTDPVAFHGTVVDTIKGLGNSPVVVPTQVLTVGEDVITGTVGNDIFTAPAAQNGAAALINTLQNVDYIDGGAGTDSLSVTESQGLTVAATIRNVELIEARFTAAGNISLINVVGATDVNIANSTVAGTVSNVGALANLAVVGQNVDATFSGNTATTVNLRLDTFGKTAAAKNVVNLDTGITTLNVVAKQAHATVAAGAASIETVNVTASGANDLDLSGSVATLKTVTVGGDGTLDLTAAVLSAVTKLDASANKGGVSVKLGAAALAVTGGAGNDVISYAPGAAIAAQTKIALGAGNDTVVLAALADATALIDGGDGSDTLLLKGAYLDAHSKASYTGFEVLEMSNNTGATLTFDTSLVSGITSYVLDQSADRIELSNLANNAAATVAGSLAGGLNMILKTVSGTTDAAALTLDNGKTAATVATSDAGVVVAGLKAVGVETLTLHSNGAVGATASSTNVVFNDALNTSLGKVLVDGSAAIKLVTGAISKALTVDASAATGAVTVDGSAATVQLNLNGGAACDTLKGGIVGGVIYGGAAGDTINLTAGTGAQDTLSYKVAADSMFAVKADGVTLDTGKTDVVSRFETGRDKIDLTSLAFSVATDKFVVQKSAGDLAALSTLAASATFYNDGASVARGVVAVAVGGDVFVFADANHDHKFNASSDLVIKLAGATLAQADIIFG